MSVYEFHSSELGIHLPFNEERQFILSYEDILYDKVPIDEIRTYMVSAKDIGRLRDDVVLHLMQKIEKIAGKGIFTESEIEQMYENSREVITDYEQLDPSTIDEVTLIDLIQKARSFHKELQQLQHGRPNRLVQPAGTALIDRINQYTQTIET